MCTFTLSFPDSASIPNNGGSGGGRGGGVGDDSGSSCGGVVGGVGDGSVDDTGVLGRGAAPIDLILKSFKTVYAIMLIPLIHLHCL